MTIKTIKTSSSSQPPARQALLRDELERVAVLLTESSCKMQDLAYENRLDALCIEALDNSDDTEIEAALSALKPDRGTAYDQLLAAAEDAAQTLEREDMCAVLVLMPVFMWSRYCNYSGPLEREVTEDLAQAYKTHLTPQAQHVVVGNVLLAPDHIPEELVRVRRVLQAMVEPACLRSGVADLTDLITETPPNDFSDTRFVAFAVVGKTSEQIFADATQTEIERARSLMQFSLQVREILDFTLIGSIFEVQPPSAFYTAWRQAETAMHIWSIKSLVAFVESMGYSPALETATIGHFVPHGKARSQEPGEIRVGICPASAPDRVVAGVAWSIVSEEFEDVAEFIASVLASRGVTNVVIHRQTFPLEWCDDCGSPYYSTRNGLVVHVEAPEDSQQGQMPPTLN